MSQSRRNDRPTERRQERDSYGSELSFEQIVKNRTLPVSRLWRLGTHISLADGDSLAL